MTGPTRSLPFLLSFSPLSFPSTSLSLRIKTEVLWCSTGCRQRQIPHHPVRIGADWSFPADSVRNLRIYLDCDASMRVHVSKTVSNCFAALRQITEYTKVCPKAGAGVTGRLSGLVTPRLRQTSPVFQGTSSIGCTPY